MVKNRRNDFPHYLGYHDGLYHHTCPCHVFDAELNNSTMLTMQLQTQLTS